MKRDFPTQDEVMLALDREDARQREVLRLHIARQKSPPIHLTGKELLQAFGWILVGVGLVVAFLWWITPWLH